MKALVAVVALVATLVAAAAGTTVLLERRLGALAPGGLTLGSLQYNGLTGRLVLGDVRARDAAGREVFSADVLTATMSPLSLLGRTLSLDRVRVIAPRLTLYAPGGVDLHQLLGSPEALALPLRVDDLVVEDGVLMVEGAGAGGAPLVVRQLDLRLGRLTTATPDQRDRAFAVEMTAYGTTIHATGQPRDGGYVVHVRTRGLDAEALVRDFPVPALGAIVRGQAEIDTDLILSGGRVLASGFVRLTDAVVALPLDGRPELRAASLAIATDSLDVVSGTGRVTRLDLVAPLLVLPATHGVAVLGEALALLRATDDLVLRRISVTDGTLVLDGPSGIRLSGVQVAAELPERRASPGWLVSARAALDGGAEVNVDGVLARDLDGLDVVTRVSHIPLARWRALVGAAPGWDGRLSFDGRVRLLVRQGEAVATAAGRAELSDVSGPSAGGFRAERIALGIRRLRWPSADAVLDRVVVTRPAFRLGVLGNWTDAVVTREVSVVDGEVRGDAPGRALHGLAVDLASGTDGLSRVRVSAATETGARVDVDRVVAQAGAAPELSLGLLALTLDEAARSAALGSPASPRATTMPPEEVSPSALPAAAIP